MHDRKEKKNVVFSLFSREETSAIRGRGQRALTVKKEKKEEPIARQLITIGAAKQLESKGENVDSPPQKALFTSLLKGKKVEGQKKKKKKKPSTMDRGIRGKTEKKHFTTKASLVGIRTSISERGRGGEGEEEKKKVPLLPLKKKRSFDCGCQQ